MVAVSRGELTACGVRSAPGGFGRLLLAGAVTLALVAWLAWMALLADVRDGSATVPAATTVVQVGAGETLWEVARRVAPNSPAAAAVRRIRELNGLDGSLVHAGQTLVVPDGAAASSGARSAASP